MELQHIRQILCHGLHTTPSDTPTSSPCPLRRKHLHAYHYSFSAVRSRLYTVLYRNLLIQEVQATERRAQDPKDPEEDSPRGGNDAKQSDDQRPNNVLEYVSFAERADCCC